MSLWTRILSTLLPKTRSSVQTAETGGTTTPSSDSTPRSITEFSAEVVRITRIMPHGNADKLEIARFEMMGIGETTYEVVVQRGTFKPGDLASYFSVDCLLPTSHPDFRFLLDRLDGKDKPVYRLRAARLRGVFSQGLLVPRVSQFADDFGADVSKDYGVTYYQAPEPGMPSVPGQPGTPKVQPFPVYAVDSLKKVPHLFNDGERVCVTEKIHGTNMRFGWTRRRFLGIPLGWKFVVGSHRVIKTGSRGNHYYGTDVWSQYAEEHELAARTKGYKGHCFYGELYGVTKDGAKIQDLTYGKSQPTLAIFDVRDNNGEYLDVWTRRNLCADLDLDHVPVISESDALSTQGFDLERIKALAEGKSLVAPNQIREGVVVESTEGPRRKAKFVGSGYLLRKE